MLCAWLAVLFLQGSPAEGGTVVALDSGWRFALDRDNRGLERGYANTGFEDSAWEAVESDRPWEAQGHEGYDGFAWYRRRVDLPRAPEGIVFLELGILDDADETFVNGKKIGATGAFPPAARSAWSRPRRYVVPEGLLLTGQNVIAVRVFDGGGDGGFRGGTRRLTYGPGTDWLVKASTRPESGFAAANFALAMELTPEGDFPARIWSNPPIPGAWLEETAVASLAFREGERVVDAAAALFGPAERRWPFARAHYRSDALPELQFELEAFCPVVRAGRPYWTAIPVGFASLRVANTGSREREPEVLWRFGANGAFRNVVAEDRGGLVVSGFDGDTIALRCDAPAARAVNGLVKEWSCKVKVPPGSAVDVRLCFARSPRGPLGSPDGVPWPESGELAVEALRRFDAVRAATRQIDQWLPLTGDAAVDEALRWYCGAVVQLTKVLADGNVAVMGYAEMTQRDAYWASVLHGVLFPDLERKMVLETFEAQRADGKIPTAILPVLDRGDDLDTNAYAILRAFRYARWSGDAPLLTSLAANLKGAAVWLTSRDTDGDGLPEAVSSGGDWKEGPAFAARRVAPHAVLLFLAALGELRGAVDAARDPEFTAELEARIRRARASLEKAAADGGLWGGRHYVERMHDGSVARQVNEDQVVGSLFGILTPERERLVFDALAANRTPWGFRESFPYRPATSGTRLGDGSNGSVFPWLNFVDAWARYGAGRAAEATAILRDVARHDLLLHAQALPHEFLDGESGEPLGNAPQAWNAAFFGAVFHGLFGVERTREGELRIAPRAILGPGWRVRVPVAEGEVEVADGGNPQAPPEVRWSLARPLSVDVRVPGCAAFVARLPPGSGVKALAR